MTKFLKSSYFLSFIICLIIFFSGVLTGDTYFITILIFAGLNALASLGLSLLMGLAGQISLGQNGFYGLGAYISAILATKYKVSPILSIPIACFISTLFAILLAIPALRLKGHYLAVATLAFGEIIYLLLNEWGPGGPSGFGDIPRLGFGEFTIESPLAYLGLIWGLLWFAFVLALNLYNSTYGKVFKALHSSEIGLKSLGINITWLKIKIFMFSAFITALAGALYSSYVTFLSPATFSVFYSILILMMVMIGGLHSPWGALLGALFITLLPEVLKPFKEYDILVYGIILTLGLLFFRQGLIHPIQRLIQNGFYFRGKGAL